VALIVMLHGCTQNPIDFATGTRMNDLADTKQFIVVYPQQTYAYDGGLCWHWMLPSSQARGSGETAIIAGITQTVMADNAHWNIDPQKVYVAGLSAGACMAVVMAATYPDLYAALGVGAGTEYKAATDSASSNTAVRYGGPDPFTQGQLAYSAMGAQARVLPVIDFHGTVDTIVYPINGDQVVQQWMQTEHLASTNYNAAFASPSATTQGSVPGGRAYTIRQWNDATGYEVQEYWTIAGMNHAWSGGSSAGSFTDPSGPSESQNMYAFFMSHPLSGAPTTAPSAPTSLTASAASATQISLNWSTSSGATSYQVQRSADGTTGWTQVGAPTPATYTDTGLTASTRYYYRVLASNAIGQSGPSNVASAMTTLAISQAPQGTWVGTYGTTGYALLAWNGSSGDLVSLGPASLVLDQGTRWTWRTGSTQVRDLQSPNTSTRRATGVYHATQLKLHLTFSSAYTGSLHLYALDGSTNARRQVITIDDGSGPRTANLNSAFDQGAWIAAPISVAAGGSVTITIDHKAGYNAVLSGLFLS
jgi:poly(hydroxyalkanoate) depolymerase family esterase